MPQTQAGSLTPSPSALILTLLIISVLSSRLGGQDSKESFSSEGPPSLSPEGPPSWLTALCQIQLSDQQCLVLCQPAPVAEV